MCHPKPTLLVAHLLFCNRKSQPKKSKRAANPTHNDRADIRENLPRHTFDRKKGST
jgi:hypothetical protein